MRSVEKTGFRSVVQLGGRQENVTICIPTWQAATFIDRTLRCARRQTHRRVRIIISVDACDDATARICQAHAQDDARLDVIVQTERLGWARNANVLLERVETEFYCLYFHDDILEPLFTERLLARLQERTDAAAAYSDVRRFGADDSVAAGPDYEGSPTERLCLFMLSEQRGAPLRALTRKSVVGESLRLPADAPDGLLANEPYLAQMIAAGPVLRVPETLYHRWAMRKGGLTDGWKALTRKQVVAGLRANTEKLLSIVESAAASQGERDLLRFAVCFYLFDRQLAMTPGGSNDRIEPQELSPLFADLTLPVELSRFTPEIRQRGEAGLAALTARSRAMSSERSRAGIPGPASPQMPPRG